jgi:PhoPQ-activated pathogenicity-related protein
METDVNGVREKLPARALDNIAAFVRSQFTGKPLPKLTWKHGETADGKFDLAITSDQAAGQARLWVATSPTKDFREARWEARPITIGDGKSITATLERPKSGYISFYADLNYSVEECQLWLCTQIRLAGAGS